MYLGANFPFLPNLITPFIRDTFRNTKSSAENDTFLSIRVRKTLLPVESYPQSLLNNGNFSEVFCTNFCADNCLSPISIKHPKHILKILNGPFRLTISLKMKGCTEVQSSTQRLMQHLINQLMQLLYYRSPVYADVCKTARWLLLTASAITFALPGWQRIEHSKFFNIFIRLVKVRVTLVLKSTNP